MAHPKRKISKTRRDKRRTHYKAASQQIATDPTTGEAHLYHRAHWYEGKLYYRGQIVLESAISRSIENIYVFIKTLKTEGFFLCFIAKNTVFCCF